MATEMDTLIDVKEKALDKLYKAATPSISYEEALELEEETDVPVYKLHYLPEDEAQEIVESTVQKHGIEKQIERDRVASAVLLGACPMGNRERVVKNREKEGLGLEMF